MRLFVSLLMVLLPVFMSASVGAAGLEAKATLQPVSPNVAVERREYAGRRALRLRDTAGLTAGDRMLLLPIRNFRNGTIEGMMAGRPYEGASATARGFIGIAFRVQADPSRYEAFYIRPSNGRAEDQLRRNRSTQYISHPDYPWERLRQEAPGVYESYADMAPGQWTRFKIEVDGDKARLFLNGADQPALIVNDLKLGKQAAGGVALWVGPETDGYFAKVAVIRRD